MHGGADRWFDITTSLPLQQLGGEATLHVCAMDGFDDDGEANEQITHAAERALQRMMTMNARGHRTHAQIGL